VAAGQPVLLSASEDNTIRLWNLEGGECLGVLRGHEAEHGIDALNWNAGAFAHSAAFDGFRKWNLAEFITDLAAAAEPDQRIKYTNAKVLLVGESGAGKTGLSKVLAGKHWEKSDSTVGAWATHWPLSAGSEEDLQQEIWLWDFGGQADQRLIHQLYMDDTSLVVLVFDGQKEDVFETIRQWDRDLSRAASKSCSKLLIAGRIDAGPLRVSRVQLQEHAKQLGFSELIETSAKFGIGCEELRQAILKGIDWERVPWRSSPILFKRLKDEIVSLKDAGRVLARFNELREVLQLRLASDARFTDEELKAVIGLLSGPGIVWELKFGSWVLLQPERINAYAQAVLQTMRDDPYERACILEERVLSGDLKYRSSAERLPDEEERFVLLAMHQILVERGFCFREQTEQGALLIFPSYYRRERPELVGHPAVLVSYRFDGFMDEIYATLIVRLHHTSAFHQDQLWRYAADFKTLTGKQLGVKLTKRAEGVGELEIYFDPMIAMEEKIIFSKYVHEHLQQNAVKATRLRHYVCPHCGTPVGNREIAMKRLEGWLGAASHIADERPTILCVSCEKRIPLWDEMEQCFASPETKDRVKLLQSESDAVLDTESKERALVGEVISTVALAGQICREKLVSDHGIDMEIEFKNDAGRATGQLVYLQLKSGDSYLSKRKSDGAEIFKIKKLRHAVYWHNQEFPVILVIRNSKGEVRWMEVRDYLRKESEGGKRQVRQIVFEGDRFDVMTVRRWRDAALRRRT
jgi:small GTP-binding protein